MSTGTFIKSVSYPSYVPLATKIVRMAVDAIQIRGGGKESHRVHEFLDGNPFQHLDVLEHVLGHQWFLLRPGAGNLTVRRSGNQQAQETQRDYHEQSHDTQSLISWTSRHRRHRMRGR